MEKSRILIISEHALFADAITHTLKEEGFLVAATAQNIDAALPLIQKHQPNIIIVDYNEEFTPDAKMFSLLNDGNTERRVIFLTLDGNRMIVHHRHQVGDATPADLISVLRTNTPPVDSTKEAT